MAVQNIYKKTLQLKYSVISDGKDKKVTQSFSNVKLTSTVDELYVTGSRLSEIINAPSITIEEQDNYVLENE